MSKSLKLAAIAAAMVVGSTSVYATGGGLTEKQVRKIVKEEVAKVRQGPRGPRGPAGMDGLPSLFAHVLLTGVVDDMLPGGITQENVVRVDTLVPTPVGQDQRIAIKYCFIGLPPVSGGQVTIVDGGSRGLASPRLDLDTQNPGCPIQVTIVDELGVDPEELVQTGADFHILLY